MAAFLAATAGQRHSAYVQDGTGARVAGLFGKTRLDTARIAAMGKGCLLWAVGIPIPIIILLYIFVF